MVRTDSDSPQAGAGVSADPIDPIESCRHDRAPLRRLGIIRHKRTGRCVYVLLCTECGFTVTTEQLRRLRGERPGRRPPAPPGEAPQWVPLGS
ncbi:MAG: hypothetical protein U9R68_04160 [Planctomycetota bacterium]|nr:hypothetical protein [Planctomycetota bacterium]